MEKEIRIQPVDINELKRRLYLQVEEGEEIKRPPSLKGSKCPKCTGNFKSISVYKKFYIDKCKKCKGIWLDYGELQDLLKLDMKVLLKLETETPKEAAKKVSDEVYYFDERRRMLQCPRCKRSLRETYFRRDVAIWVEICDHCKGAFYDHGELTKVIKLLKKKR